MGTRLEAKQQLGLDVHKPVILITGGSLGAVSLNTAVSEGRVTAALAPSAPLEEHGLQGRGGALRGDEVILTFDSVSR